MKRPLIIAGIAAFLGLLLADSIDAQPIPQAKDTTQCSVTCGAFNTLHADAGMTAIACGSRNANSVKFVIVEADKANGIYVCDDSVALADITTKCVLYSSTSIEGGTFALNNAPVRKPDGTPLHYCAGGTADAGAKGIVWMVEK